MSKVMPPDHLQRERALDPTRSILVQAPAGSGKTTLLTERFLTLLAEVDEPSQVVAITFTIAAAAEMRNRILDALRAPNPSPLAQRVLNRAKMAHSSVGNWQLLDLPNQLRISTIDSFCRELAIQQPLLSGLGGGLAIAEQPDDLYRRAARQTLQQIDTAGPGLSAAIADLLLWRDNNWQELENQLVEMLKSRDRWMHDFVLARDPDRELDWDALRQRLERPFEVAVRDGLNQLYRLLNHVPDASDEALELARFACRHPFGDQHRPLAELTEFPAAPFHSSEKIEAALDATTCLANMLLTTGDTLRKQVDKRLGFPAEYKAEKARILNLIADLDTVPGFEAALARVRQLPPLHYSDDEWKIVKACFILLRQAAVELKVVFAEAARVDFIEVSQIALSVLKAEDGRPSDAAIALGDGIRHLLVDEFQDTSRRQHQLLSALVAAWAEPGEHTCFAVGDPMQSIYFFREADVELFTRVKEFGLETPHGEPLPLDFVPLSANFRTLPSLVEKINEVFVDVFAVNDGSNVVFSPSTPSRNPLPSTLKFESQSSRKTFKLHLNFSPQTIVDNFVSLASLSEAESSPDDQVQEIVELIRSYLPLIDQARSSGQKCRIAVLARARKSLASIALALREAAIPFRAVELEKLSSRPEILDALALGHALFNRYDRIAWLGVLRAPWCGLALDDLHLLTSADSAALLVRPIPELLRERLSLLSEYGQRAAARVLEAIDSVPSLRSTQPTSSLGTWLQQIWLRLGGAACVDETARANLDLLWACLDKLPGGEQDLLAPALDAALDKLTALPDPAAGTDRGVQLMTIHKSKGLEFEVVIVPDLEAGTGGGKPRMLSWLERGLAEPDDSGEITEFLIAPQQSKGADRSGTKAWVDCAYKEREKQEDRRILYVAATRARDELHFFARPSVKLEKDGTLSLVEPTRGLLKTAWPAFESEIRARFEDWKASCEAAQPGILDIAAAAESNLLVMPSQAPAEEIKPTLLRRLPPDYRSPLSDGIAAPQANQEALQGTSPGAHSPDAGAWERNLYDRHQGGLLSRALGTAVHALLEQLSRLRESSDWPTAQAALSNHEPRIAAQVRALGVDQAQAGILAADAVQIALAASNDPFARWILSPHAEAASEIGWTGVVAGSLTTVRVDRIFRAGLAPQSEAAPESSGRQAWWIIDYKTADADLPDPAAALPGLRQVFAPQLEAYGKILRNLHGPGALLRAGLYYPRMRLFDWWDLE